MLNQKDLDYRQFVVLNSIFDPHHLCVSKGNAVIRNNEGAVLTKLSKHKVLGLMIIGHYTLTSPLVDFCHKNSIALIVVNTRLRPVFFESKFSEGNYLLRQRQHRLSSEFALYYASGFVSSKIFSHICQVKSLRKKTESQKLALETLKKYYFSSLNTQALDSLMGVEGNAAKLYFQQYFVDMGPVAWKGRKPRLKTDPINVTLDIGYTLLFNFVECIVRLFGFDVYVGVLHQLWFRRKSLICDFVEPFRCIVDKQVVKAFRLGQFDIKHFALSKDRLSLKTKHISEYNTVLMTAIVKYKLEIFNYVRDYYRVFMKQDMSLKLPFFQLSTGVEPTQLKEDL